ncbi:hypothetical protein BDF19DRAFT_440584 [Syncephalis fuscata]|nr:hypothetical protein BDF19DRAFT_440584 [Syncephalis fuscata]
MHISFIIAIYTFTIVYHFISRKVKENIASTVIVYNSFVCTVLTAVADRTIIMILKSCSMTMLAVLSTSLLLYVNCCYI